jgi:hypothetical protein
MNENPLLARFVGVRPQDVKRGMHGSGSEAAYAAESPQARAGGQIGSTRMVENELCRQRSWNLSCTI